MAPYGRGLTLFPYNWAVFALTAGLGPLETKMSTAFISHRDHPPLTIGGLILTFNLIFWLLKYILPNYVNM